MPHKFDWFRGVGHQFLFSSSKNAFAKQHVFLGLLSCINLCPLSKTSLIKGSKWRRKTASVKNNTSIIPAKMAILLTPCCEIAAQTWTLTGCFGWPFRCGGSHHQGEDILEYHSRAMVLSSVKITSLNFSFLACYRWQNSRRLIQITSLTIWQYFVPVDSHPSLWWVWCTVCSEILMLYRYQIIFVRSGDLVSLLSSISQSMKSKILSVTFVNMHWGCVFMTSPVSLCLQINRTRWHLSIKKLSCCSLKARKTSHMQNPSRCNRITVRLNKVFFSRIQLEDACEHKSIFSSCFVT